MFFSESRDITLRDEDMLAEVEAQYYQFLDDQGELKINLRS